MTTVLDRRLAAALQTITVSPDCRAARVGPRKVSAAGPATLRRELAMAIYDELHAGRGALRPPPGRYLRDQAVEERLEELMPHMDTVRDALVLDTRPEEFLVRLDGVKVWVRSARLSTGGAPVQAGTRAPVRVPAARPALSAGYFLADSAVTWIPDGAVLRVYVHVTSMTAAFGAWSAVLRTLTELGGGYRVKVASSPELLPRRDGLVVYVAGGREDMVRRIASAMAPVSGIGPESSVFAKPVAPGVAIAWEPTDARPQMRGLSFGEHRSAVLAQALTEHAERAAGDSYPVTAAVVDAFLAAGIDPADPACPLSR